MSRTLLPKRLALPIFCSDPLSSIVMPPRRTARSQRRRLTLVHLTRGSPRPGYSPGRRGRVIPADVSRLPQRGGAYAVSRANLGRNASWSRPAPCSSTTSSRWRCRWPQAWPTSSRRCHRWPPTRWGSRWAGRRTHCRELRGVKEAAPSRAAHLRVRRRGGADAGDRAGAVPARWDADAESASFVVAPTQSVSGLLVWRSRCEPSPPAVRR